MSDTWRVTPIKLAIMQTLEKRKGLLLENDLLVHLEKVLGGIRPSPQELNKELLTLEIHGLIHVTNLKKNERRITTVSSEQQFLLIGED